MWVITVQSRFLLDLWVDPCFRLPECLLASFPRTHTHTHTFNKQAILLDCTHKRRHTHTLTVTPGSPPCLATVSFKEPQFSKHWYKEGSNSILMVWGSSSWAWVSWLLTTWKKQVRVRCAVFFGGLWTTGRTVTRGDHVCLTLRAWSAACFLRMLPAPIIILVAWIR